MSPGTAAGDPDGRDPGLAAERTQLAWSRSTLALFAFGAAIAKGLPRLTGTPGRPLAGLAICGLGVVIWFSALPYARDRRHPDLAHPDVHRRAMATMAFGTAAAGIGALLLDLVLVP